MEGEDDADVDPLIKPCLCRGSVEHVHRGCLQHWIRSKVKNSLEKDGSCVVDQPQCELSAETRVSETFWARL